MSSRRAAGLKTLCVPLTWRRRSSCRLSSTSLSGIAFGPIARTLDAASNLRTQDRMRSLASEPRLVVRGHDPAVFTRFPKVSDRIVPIE